MYRQVGLRGRRYTWSHELLRVALSVSVLTEISILIVTSFPMPFFNMTNANEAIFIVTIYNGGSGITMKTIYNLTVLYIICYTHI